MRDLRSHRSIEEVRDDNDERRKFNELCRRFEKGLDRLAKKLEKDK